MKKAVSRAPMLAFALALLGASGVASAQDSKAAEAKRHYELGYEALQAERYEEALDHYVLSYDLIPRPRTLFNIAVAEEMLGQLEDALRHYEQFIEDAEDRDADFKKQAEAKVAQLSRRIGVDVDADPPGPSVPVEPPPPATIDPVVLERPPVGDSGILRVHSNIAGAMVSVDGLVVGTTAQIAGDDGDGAGFRHEVDPGEHDIIIERTGARTWHQRLHVAPGETVRVNVAFRDTHVSRTSALTWGLAGLGVASIATGGVLGTVALRDVTSDDPDDHGRGKTRALVTDVLIVGGAVALYTAWRLSKRPKTTATVKRTHRDTEAER